MMRTGLPKTLASQGRFTAFEAGGWGAMSNKTQQSASDFGRLQGVLVGVPLAKIEPQYDDKGRRISRLLTWSTGETCLVTG